MENGGLGTVRGIEEQQIHAGGVPAEDREVHAIAAIVNAQRQRASSEELDGFGGEGRQ
jgi:hypothetical protein